MKKIISTALLVLAALKITFTYSDSGIVAYLIAWAMFLVGLYLCTEKKTALIGLLSMAAVLVLGFFGGLVEILDYGFDIECANLWHSANAFCLAFAALTKHSSIIVPIANTDEELYEKHCRRYGIQPDDIHLCFMTRYNDRYIAIGHNDVIYSYTINNGVSNISQIRIDTISRYEKYGENGILNGVRVFTGGSYHNYEFIMGEQETFIKCLDYIMQNPAPKYENGKIIGGTIDDIFERFDHLCIIGGVNPDIYKYNA